MSVARPAPAQVRHPPAASSRATSAAAAGRGTSFVLAASGVDDEIKLNLSDIPRMPGNMDVEGFKPSLLSRLLNLIAPIRAG